MTDEEKEFVREVDKDARSILWNGLQSDTPLAQAIIDTAKGEANIKLRLLTLLIESEADNQILKWQRDHRECDPPTQCNGPGIDVRHSWVRADWIAAVKREIGIL